MTPSDLNIAFEDDHIVVVDKPSGVLSQPGKTIDGSVATAAKARFPDATGPMLVHRLDMDTSGLLLLAKTRESHRALQQQFEKRTVRKQYVAVLGAIPAAAGGMINLPLRLNVDNRPEQIVCFQHGKPAETLWRKNRSDPYRIDFFPVTGRTHQLRVHAARGLMLPIVGDRLYGVAADRLMLHASMLIFDHPVTQERVAVNSPAPF